MAADPLPPIEVALTPQQQPIREELINTAVKFLQNPNVIKTSLGEQQKFLQRKGLTDEEIRIACERSGAYVYHEQQRSPNQPPPLPNPALMGPQIHYQVTLFDRVREVVHNFAIFSFVAYVVYKFYEKYIAPFLFGRKKKSVEDSIDDLEKNVTESLTELRTHITDVRTELDRINNQGSICNTQTQLADLKSEIGTVKGLLLSRSQFPSVSKSSVIRPSIPEWQKSSLTHDSDAESDPERKHEELSDHGSGSGSSEPEHITTKSDSSLDIISFSSKDSDFQRHKLKDDSDKD